MMFKEDFHKTQGENEIQHLQQQNVIADLLNQLQTPYSIFSDKKQKP